MSQLIKLRHRIRAIETTKKVTHAMRLISMSSHTQLKGRHDALKLYKGAVHDLFKKVMAVSLESKHKALQISGQSAAQRPLHILVGSQKGLCGIFNSALFSFFEKKAMPESAPKPCIIAIGKKAVDYMQTHPDAGTVIALYDSLTIHNHLALARTLTDMIMQAQEPYTSVVVFSNVLRGFFTQKPMQTTLLPLEEDFTDRKLHKDATEQLQEEYIWEQAPEDVITMLSQHYFEVTLQYLLFQSLLAEHAARFLSMDNATRNADNLLEQTRINYNKLRQAKITKELSELAGSFQVE